MSRASGKGRIFSTRRKRLVAHIADFGGRCVQDLVSKPEGKRLLGRPRDRWEDNTKIVPKGVG